MIRKSYPSRWQDRVGQINARATGSLVADLAREDCVIVVTKSRLRGNQVESQPLPPSRAANLLEYLGNGTHFRYQIRIYLKGR